MPLMRPSSNQMVSATAQAKTATTRAASKFIRCVPAKAPAASRIGIDGTGNPICSRNTHARSTT